MRICISWAIFTVLAAYLVYKYHESINGIEAFFIGFGAAGIGLFLGNLWQALSKK